VGELNPQGERQAGSSQWEGHHLGSTSATRFIAEEEVVIGLNDFTAILARQVERTTAVELVRQVDTSGGERAGSRNAFDNVLLAVAASESFGTDALISRSVVDTSGSILTSSGSAGIKFVLTTDADVICVACTIETGSKVTTLSVVHARVADATIRCRLAPLPIRSGGAGTKEIAQQVYAVSIIHARLRIAEADVLLASLTSPAYRREKKEEND